MEKITNKVALEFVLGLDQVKENQEVFEKLEKMLEQVQKKSSSAKSGKPTKAQMENLEIIDRITEVLSEVDEPIQIKELMTMEGLEFSNQKLSALIRQMVASGTVVRIEEKKVAKFKLA